jgi:hypothetical protein
MFKEQPMQEPTDKKPEAKPIDAPEVDSGVVFLGEVYQETRNAVSFGFGDDQFKFFSVYD